MPTLPVSSDSTGVLFLKVRPDGNAFAVLRLTASAGLDLVVWQAGDAKATSLGTGYTPDLSWSSDGLYVARRPTAASGPSEVLHYRWGHDSPEVAVAGDRLDGQVRGLRWDERNGRLIFADNAGLKAVSPANGVISRLGGLGIPDTITKGGIWSPDGRHYITTRGDEVVVADLASSDVTVLVGRETPPVAPDDRQLHWAAWSPNGDQVVVQLGTRWFDHVRLSQGEPPILDRQSPQEGRSAVFAGDQVCWVSRQGGVVAFPGLLEPSVRGVDLAVDGEGRVYLLVDTGGGQILRAN